jgi:phage tail protein X
MEGQNPSMLRPALIAGTAFGVAGAIPVLNWINCACCALIIGCGFVAAWLFSQSSKAAGVGFTVGNGAAVGLASGAVYGVVTGIVSAALSTLFGLNDWHQVVDQLEEVGTMDPAVVDQINRFMESTGPATLTLAGVFFSILFGVIFATVGGLIGGAVFKAAPATDEGTGWTPPPPPPPVAPTP